MQHCRRANYQCFLWKNALCAKPDVPTPDGNGWTIVDGEVQPVLMTQESAPKEMTELTTCKCKASRCATDQCICKKVSLSCTTMCLCEADEEIYANSGYQGDECYSSEDDSEEQEETE